MGDFDFGQFQQIMDYLSKKLSEGGALTPEEQQIYNQLTALAGQGLNLTNTADFNSLYNAFNGLADQATKNEFESLYGTGLIQNPDGTISFSKPGSIIEALQRRGQSINDGPAQAQLAEGLKHYLTQIAQNKYQGMTSAYSAMTPIRAQNIQAYTNAGNIASTAIGRRVPIVGAAISGARGGAGDSGGEGININTNGPGGPSSPSFWDKYGGSIIGLLGTAGLGAGGYLLKKWWDDRNKTPEGNDLMREVQSQDAPSRPPSYMGSMRQNDVYDYVPETYGAVNNPYAGGNSFPVDKYFNQSDQSSYTPQSVYPTQYNFQQYDTPQQTPTWDQWTGNQDQGWYQPEQSSYPDQWSYSGGGGDIQYYNAPAQNWQDNYDYNAYSAPEPTNWYDESY